MKKFLPVVFCGLAAISYSQLTLAGGDYNKSKDSSAGAGPTDNPNVTRDAQGREHVNKGKHTGQTKNKARDQEQSSGSGSTSDPAKASDSTSGARSSDSSSPSVSGSTSGSASGSTSAETK